MWAPKVYIVQDDEELLDALFDRDYKFLANKIKELMQAGFYALQTTTESEMVCAFKNAKIFSVDGKPL